MDYLQLSGKNILVVGLANRKSVAWHAGALLREAGARVLWSVRSEERRTSASKLVGPDEPLFVCDVERQTDIDRLRDEVSKVAPTLHGIVHSIAYADYSFGRRPFHQVPRAAFLQAIDISCYSLIALSEAFRERLDPTGSVVTVSISTTRMAAENYGYMAPVKAALDSTICFLAKSFSEFSRVRFNAVCPGLLKTSASAGIPNYVDSYLFAERATLRKEAVRTEEVAAAIAFLLSPRSSGINAQGLVIDAGMGINYFDRQIVTPGDANPPRGS